MTSPITPERTISTSRKWSCEKRSTWPGKTKPAELRGDCEQRRDGRRRRRDRLLDERAKVALKRLKSDLDMRGGRRSDDDCVRLDLLDEAQGIGEALRERRA